MMSEHRSIRAYVNAKGVDVPPGATALDAVRTFSADEADAVSRGERVITDSRGLPVGGDVTVHAGSIFRTVTARKASSHPAQADGAGEDT